MDVVVTGSHGLIGSALRPALERAGHRVVRLVRDGDRAPDTLQWDPEGGKIDAAGLEGVGAVVHLAGAGIGDKKWTADRKREILESRTKGTSLLAGALAKLTRPPGALISASAVGYYGPHGDEVLTEESPAGNDFLADVCVQWEAATKAAEDAGIRVSRVRSGIVLSKDGGVLKRMLTPFRLGLGGRIGNGKQYMSWITIDDEVAAIEHVLGHDDLGGAVNLTAPNPVTNAAFTKTLGHLVRRPTTRTPLRPVKILYGTELVHALLLAGQRVVPARLQAGGFSFRHTDLDDALRSVLDKPKR